MYTKVLLFLILQERATRAKHSPGAMLTGILQARRYEYSTRHLLPQDLKRFNEGSSGRKDSKHTVYIHV